MYTSLNEIYKDHLRAYKGRGLKYSLAITLYKPANKKSRRTLVFCFNPSLLQNAKLKSGNKINLLFDYDKKEGILELVTAGGRTLSGKAGRFHRVQYPLIEGYNLPFPEEITPIPDKQISINDKGIHFSLEGLDIKYR